MVYIYKLRGNSVIDFAAQELEKYLRMMIPEVGCVQISTDAAATTGYRLGLLEDFGLDAGPIDPVLDDIVHIDTDENGGILAGSNPRSVLFAVYRLLKLNGCRFLFPGAEGERIPQKPLTPQKYHKLASYKIRGRTIEGVPSLEEILASLDFYAKEELNTFGCYGIATYMERFYNHEYNQENRGKEFFDPEQSETQYRGLFEAEALKRGMMLSSGEHEMIPNALGLRIPDRHLYRTGALEIPQEVIPYLAQINGKRFMRRNDILFTNVCMSKPELREKMAQAVVTEIENRPHLSIFGVTVADGYNNHCECEACQEKIPSDWYIMILNRIDEILTERKIDTRILFSFYVDMIFAPETERLNNPGRFLFQYCPISRTYTESLQKDAVLPEPIKYVRNQWIPPKTNAEVFALFKKWQEVFPGPYSVFEYHFWTHQYRDPGMMAMSRRIYEDVGTYAFTNMDGCTQDGSNKSFWPNGFHCHIFNEAMLNKDCDFDAELEDFYSSLYGENWKVARDYLQAISDAFDHKYMCGEKSVDKTRGKHYNPDHAKSLEKVEQLTRDMLAFVETVQPAHRVEYQGWKLLRYHAMYCADLAKVMILKCIGKDEEAKALWQQVLKDFGKHEYEVQRWFDFALAARAITAVINQLQGIEL